ncbi:hypothetical protein DFH94DRAFT_721830 [Russula ochroleuca]|jgi:hypothetical protein|uniref:Uncharacterized protein n=1 Tax=Russula ochroleuca TaxID=152965 RepID=A0A9P5N0L9_9AGAM|nr:hypothetical protein DFH94DRAFT_721830 [Russula ochroleuca]
MFGESESESPRVPSPWDSVVTPASVDKLHYRQDELLLPKLAAEVEEGNVEYKLHLINPSSSRFARLVTQMKWRLLEGGGQAIYELGVADSGDLVGLLPDDLRATLDTLHAMAAEIGARVIISKEIEVTDTDIPEAGFRAQVHKRHGSRDSRRTAAKEHPKAQTYPIVAESPPRSFVSAASTSTPSSLDSTGSLIADSCSLASDYSPLSSPSLPTSSPISNDGIVHDDDSLLVFPMLTDSFPRCPMPPNNHIGGEESFIDSNYLDTIPEKSLTSVERGLDARELHQVQFKGDVGPEPTGIDALPDPDELLLAALSKLGIAASPSVPEEPKRRIVEALIIRELDHEEGFLDFSSF